MNTEEKTPPLNEAELEALDEVLGESERVEGGCPCQRDCGAKVPTKRKVKGVGK